MKNLLLNLYYDGYTVAEAMEFIERCYGDRPTERQIENIKKSIKKTTGNDWN